MTNGRRWWCALCDVAWIAEHLDPCWCCGDDRFATDRPTIVATATNTGRAARLVEARR